MELTSLFETYAPWLSVKYLGLEVWIWLALPLLLVSSWVAARLIVRTGGAIARGLSGRVRKAYESLVKPFLTPLELFMTMLLFTLGGKILPLTEAAESYVSLFQMLLGTFAVLLATLRITDVVVARTKDYFAMKNNPGAVAVLPLLSKILKIFIFIVAGLFLLQNFGFDIAAIIAALGIGGVAIALASQKSVENLFGGVMLSLDQPVRVGDFCLFNGMVGTIEDIGLRSTKIRTLNRTLVSIPNAEFAGMQLENFAHRDKILIHTTIGVRYETTPDQMRRIIMDIRKMLLGHPMVDKDPARARFINFNDYSLDIEIFSYIKTNDWTTFLEVREDIFLRIMDIIHDAGSDFAFPSQTIYFERGAGLPEKTQKSVHKQMEQLRKENRRFFPDLDDEEKAAITNTLSYPG